MQLSTRTLLALTSASLASAANITIAVGQDGLVFSPETSTANVGDILNFHFYESTGPHSVVRGDFDSPCTPSSTTFFSGLLDGTSTGNEIFAVQVTDTNPIVRRIFVWCLFCFNWFEFWCCA